MFENASPFPWLVEGNVLYRIDKVKGGTEKKTEIARFRVFQIVDKSSLKGVSIEEAHDNAALVAHAIRMYAKMKEFLEWLTHNTSYAPIQRRAAKLWDDFYAKEDVSQD